uniref:Dermokine n=1 Tax=Sciurus vulgaris TaxID=55149 RepID=A0A8D2DZQ1_SCIVU
VLRTTSLPANDGHGTEESDSGRSSGSSGSGGGNKPECDNPGNEARVAGGSGSQNSQTSPGLFNFDTFWKNFKSKLGFINWDAIEKDQRSFRIP